MTFVLPENYLCLYRNQQVQDFITDFMESDKGNKCRVRFSVNRKIVSYYDDKKYTKNLKTFVPLTQSNFLDEMSHGASHFFMHLFKDDIVLNGLKCPKSLSYEQNLYNFREYAENQYCGIQYTVDIDAPRLHPKIKGNLERHDFFEESVIKQFNQVTELVCEELEDMYDFRSMFSGNGYYFVLEPYYTTNSNKLFTYKKLIETKLDKVDELLKDYGNPIEIKAKAEGWNRYYKLPFAIHRHKFRMAIPLNNNHIGNINSEWLDKVTDIRKVIQLCHSYKEHNGRITHASKYQANSNTINEIIDKAEW